MSSSVCCVLCVVWSLDVKVKAIRLLVILFLDCYSAGFHNWDSVYSEKYIKEKLIKPYGEHIQFSEVCGRRNVM